MTKRSSFLRFLFFIVMIVFFSISVSAQESIPLSEEEKNNILDQGDVRGFIWGLPPSIIKEGEKGIFMEEDEEGTLYFFDRIQNRKSSIAYQFKDDKLYRVQIFSENKYPRPQKRVDDLITIKQYLTKRFGEPIKEDFQWKGDDSNRKYPDQWGWLIYRGDLAVTITWENEETFVTAYVGAPEPYRPVLYVTYEDIKAKRALRDKKAEKSIKILP